MQPVTNQPVSFGYDYKQGEGQGYGMSQVASNPYSNLRMLEQHGDFTVNLEVGQRHCCWASTQLRIYDGVGQEILLADQVSPQRRTVEHTFRDVLGTEVMYSKLSVTMRNYSMEVHSPRGTKLASFEVMRTCCPCIGGRRYFMKVLDANGTPVYQLYTGLWVAPCTRTVDITIESVQTNTDVGTINMSQQCCDFPYYKLSVPANMHTSHKAALLGFIPLLVDLYQANRG